MAEALRLAIEEEARRLGFHWVGITTPEAPPHWTTYEAWLREGRQGEMAYLASDRARQRRLDPRQILPECRSILVLGAPYDAPQKPERFEPGSSPHALHGKLAAYAWGEDYHEILGDRLRILSNYIETKTGASVLSRWYTDTGPVLERDLAQRAGLGWIGKNTCLIHPTQGSYFLLAEILLSIELEPDQPFPHDRCGSCTRCLEACPTACILPDRTLDARRCISYLTIELKGAIPVELRPQIGDWVFGCDICQQVCPWNLRFAAAHGDPAFSPRPDVPRPDLLAELGLSPEQFNRKFKGSPVKRAKRRGYLRNVAVALGNLGDETALPVMIQALGSEPEPLVRGHIAWALGRLGGETAQLALQQAAQIEKDAYVLTEIWSALNPAMPASTPPGD
ncbi:MAG: tRNA epoxyqueuosine(34) reductase QueG [Chloroflexi bacterium RBG_16_57_11]|nr:MAG: tRNA epoxyqueuosine(34) reductase QueG [Chloroflexi bacterium RBG_16_57_11]